MSRDRTADPDHAGIGTERTGKSFEPPAGPDILDGLDEERRDVLEAVLLRLRGCAEAGSFSACLYLLRHLAGAAARTRDDGNRTCQQHRACACRALRHRSDRRRDDTI
jgi:hypothetical protein